MYGLSRDDAGAFLEAYEKNRIITVDPFVSIDQPGVGELVRIGVERGRGVRPDLKIGICGEHGGDPASVLFFARAGLDYVSASPYRVPIARLAAAQAALLGTVAPTTGAKPRASKRGRDDRHRRVLIAAGRRSAAKRVAVGGAAKRHTSLATLAKPGSRGGAKSGKTASANMPRKPVKTRPTSPRRAGGGKKGPKGRGGKRRR